VLVGEVGAYWCLWDIQLQWETDLPNGVDEAILEAWERMTYSGINGVDAIPVWLWRAELNTALRSWAYREWGRNVGR